MGPIKKREGYVLHIERVIGKRNSFKLEEIRKEFFIVRAVRHWHGLPRELRKFQFWKCSRPDWVGLEKPGLVGVPPQGSGVWN